MVARVAEILVVMEDPRTRHAMVSERTLPFTEFMHDVGTLKRRPASWHDLFFEDIHHLDGSELSVEKSPMRRGSS